MTHLCGIGPFWDSINLQLFLGTIMVARDEIVNLVICLLMYGVIKCGHHLMHLHFIYNHCPSWACLLMEFGFCQPIEFDNVTYSICFGYDQTRLQMVGVNAIAISKQ